MSGRAVAAVVTLAVAGCGGASDTAVVTIGDGSITRAEFERWFDIWAASAPVGGEPEEEAGEREPGAELAVPRPPDFEGCVAIRRAEAANAGRSPAGADGAFVRACREQYEALRERVLHFLISARWIEGEAAAAGIDVSTAEVRRARALRETGAGRSAVARVARSSRMSPADVDLVVRVGLLRERLRRRALAAAAGRSADGRRDPAESAGRERRRLQAVVSQSRPSARRALAAMRAGRPVRTVALDITRGQADPDLEAAAFGARASQLRGPVETPFGFVVFRVNVGRQAPPIRTTASRRELQARRQQQALRIFEIRFRKKWRARTICRDDFKTRDCR